MNPPFPIPTYSPVSYPNGIFTTFAGVTAKPGLEIAGGSGSALVSNANLFTLIQGDTASYVLANATFPVLGGGPLAFDNGSVPNTTLSCRMYTFLATVNYDTSVVTISVVNGPDFEKQYPMHPSLHINYGDPQYAPCVIGSLYIKNESSAPFIPGTTNLDASGITATFTDGYGYPIWVPKTVPTL